LPLAIGFGSDLACRVVLGWRFHPVPNIATEYLHRLYGVILNKGSLPDGLILLDDGRFIELKRVSSHVGSAVNLAISQAPEIAFISSMRELPKGYVTKKLKGFFNGSVQIFVG